MARFCRRATASAAARRAEAEGGSRNGSARGGALRGGVDGVARLARGREQAVALGAAEADVAAHLGQADPADELAGGSASSAAAKVFPIPAFSFQGSDSLPGVTLAKQRPKFPTAPREPLARPLLEQDP
jgi:hypothetical protein